MRMTVLALGYRGDVQPQVALAAGLRDAGHTVRFATTDDFAHLARDAGLSFYRLSSPIAPFIGGAAGAALRDRMNDPDRFAHFVESYLNPYLPQFFDEALEACRDAEVIFGLSMTRMIPSLAEGLKVPCFVAASYPMPHLPTRAFPYPFCHDSEATAADAGRDRRSWSHGRRLYAGFAQTIVDRWRQESLGLRPQPWRDEYRALRRLPHLLGFSPTILARPREWPAWIHVTGHWFLEAPPGYVPPPELSEFLREGPRPVVVSFSSQVGRHPRRLNEAVVEALRLSGCRGLLLSGWGGLRPDRLPPDVLHVPSVPHDWLFPRVAAVVHHGGAGTTAAALRAGVPSVAVPFGYDQMLWGQQIARLGAGPEPLPSSMLTAEALRAEDGVTNAVASVQRELSRR